MKNKKIQTQEKIKKKQQIMAFTLAGMLGLSALGGMGVSFIKNNENSSTGGTKIKKEQTGGIEEEKKELEYYNNEKVVLDVEKMIGDIKSIYHYDFDEQIIEEGLIKEYKDKKSNLKLFSPTEKDLIFPYIMNYKESVSYNDFIENFDITKLPLMDFILDRELGITKTELTNYIDKIKETEKIDKGGEKEKQHYYNSSYNIVQDIYLNIYIISNGETVEISYDIEDVNPLSIVYIRDYEKIDEVAYVNKFKPSISTDNVLYQKRIAKDYFEYIRDFSTGLGYFSFSSLEPLERELFNAQVSYLTALLLDSLGIKDSKGEKEYVLNHVNKAVQQFLEKGINGVVEVPIELFLWSFSFSITGTENQYKASFDNIKYLDDFEGKYIPIEETLETNQEIISEE